MKDFARLIFLLNKYGGIAYTEKLAAEYIEKAKHTLSIFNPSETKKILLDVADYTLKRSA